MPHTPSNATHFPLKLLSDFSADPQGFRDEANGIFKALHQRIQRENQELYPLAEKKFTAW